MSRDARPGSRGHRSGPALAFAALVGTALALIAPAAALATPAPLQTRPTMLPDKPETTQAQRAVATVTPALVSIDVTWEGWVRHKVTGALLDEQSVTVSTRCGGVAVSGDGYLITAGECVAVDSVATQFYQQIVQRRLAKGLVAPDQTHLLLADLLVNGAIVGQPVDGPPKRIVTVRREVTPDDALPATVVSVTPPPAIDVALLKIEKTNQPMVPLADPADVKAGTEVVTIEYANDDPRASPTARTGSIAQTDPVLLANAGPSNAVPGAAVLNLDGELVGVLSRHQPVSAMDVLAPVSAVAQELKDNDVSNGLGPLDRDYREGLDAYYNGRYTDSIERFDAVLAVVPSHAQAHVFRDQAQALREAEGGGRHADSGMFASVQGWLSGALGPLAIAAVLAGAGLILVRRRGHGRAAGVATVGTTPVGQAAAGGAAARPARVRIDTPTYCSNCSNALPPAAGTCPRCGYDVPAV